MVVWALHRDTADILAIGLLVFSTVGEWTVTSDDVVFGDEDGVLFVPASGVAEALSAACRRAPRCGSTPTWPNAPAGLR